MRTASAAEAVHDRYDDIVFVFRCCFDFLILIAFGSLGSFFRRHEEGTDSSVRTYEGTLVTADTLFSIPARYEHGNAAFFFSSRAGRPTTVFKAVICADRKVVAFESIYRNGEVTEEFRVFRHIYRFVNSISPSGRNINFDDSRQALVNRFVVHINDVLTFFAVRFDNGFFQFRDSQVKGNDVSQFKEG